MLTEDLTGKVRQVLLTKKRARDDDRFLLAAIWAREVGRDKLEDMNAKMLLTYYMKGLLPSSESIRRTRQKLQQHHPELRGEKYQERQQVREPDVRDEMRKSI